MKPSKQPALKEEHTAEAEQHSESTHSSVAHVCAAASAANTEPLAHRCASHVFVCVQQSVAVHSVADAQYTSAARATEPTGHCTPPPPPHCTHVVGVQPLHQLADMRNLPTEQAAQAVAPTSGADVVAEHTSHAPPPGAPLNVPGEHSEQPRREPNAAMPVA
jgi:hypothetical protein